MILTISPSSLETLQECPQKYEYGSIRRLRPLEEKRDKMDRGSLVHEMLELHYKSIIEGKLSVGEIIMIVTDFARQKYRDDEYEFGIVEQSIPNYQEYATFYAGDGWQPLAVETPFTKVLFENDQHKIVSEGKIDLIVRNISGQTFPVAHKTSDKNDLYPTILSNQFMCYAWSTDSAIIVKNDIGFQKSYGPAQRFHRHMLNYDPAILAEWRENAIYHCMKLINFVENEHFPRQYSSCFRCRYRKVCESTPDAREYKISSQYKVGEAFDIYA